MTNTSTKIVLECEHELWLRPPLPHLGETLWCAKCTDYKAVGPGLARFAKTVLDTWTSEVHAAGGWIGTCNDCDHRLHEKRSWYTLKNKMERHYLHHHSGSTLISQSESVPIPTRLPPNSKAPF